MIDKIYEKIKEEQCSSMNTILNMFNITSEDNKVIGGTPKKNIDLSIILTKLNLVELEQGIGEQIDEFHDYLFKLGIENGISMGKQMLINQIICDEADIDKIMDIDPNEIVNFNYALGFLEGLMGDLNDS